MSLRQELSDKDRFETKSVQVRDGEATQHAMVITRFMADGDSPLSAEGYSGTNYIFSVVVGGTIHSDTDPFSLTRGTPLRDRDSFAFKLAYAVEGYEGVFEELRNGEVVDPDRMSELEDE